MQILQKDGSSDTLTDFGSSVGSVFVSVQPTSVLKNRPRKKIHALVGYERSVICPRFVSM